MLDAAGEAFAADGFHGASMDGIATAAGISKPMLYNYFGSKEGLYAAYVQRSGRAMMEALRHSSSPDAPPQDRLRAGVLAFFTFVDEHRAGWAVLYNEAAVQGGPVAAGVASLRSGLADIVARAVGPSGKRRRTDDSAAAFAHAFVGAGESLANWWLAHPAHDKADVAAMLLRFADAAAL